MAIYTQSNTSDVIKPFRGSTFYTFCEDMNDYNCQHGGNLIHITFISRRNPYLKHTVTNTMCKLTICIDLQDSERIVGSKQAKLICRTSNLQ